MTDTEAGERWTWRLYVCPSCGGYGHNNTTIHLRDDCDRRQVEEIYVVRESRLAEREAEIQELIPRFEQVECQLAEREAEVQEAKHKLQHEIKVREDIAASQQDARCQLQEAREAIRQAMSELGVPGARYPQPIVNAVEILRAALSPPPELYGGIDYEQLAEGFKKRCPTCGTRPLTAEEESSGIMDSPKQERGGKPLEQTTAELDDWADDGGVSLREVNPATEMSDSPERGEAERYETTVHDKRTGQPVRGCDGDAIAALAEREAELERARESMEFMAEELDNHNSWCAYRRQLEEAREALDVIAKRRSNADIARAALESEGGRDAD